MDVGTEGMDVGTPDGSPLGLEVEGADVGVSDAEVQLSALVEPSSLKALSEGQLRHMRSSPVEYVPDKHVLQNP
jgi:hypothetical protein